LGWKCCYTPSCAEVILFAELSLSATVQAAWGKPVLDRVGLIIEIFGAHAQTKEAKLQVELAALDYKKTRLVRVLGKGGARLGFGVGGEDEVVSARG
jgi:50S ribosomal subunit-associated GTPase HflX